MSEWKLKPGSPEAKEAGCLCPRSDNAHGRGAWGTDGEIYFITTHCPLHGNQTSTPDPISPELVHRREP